ncbi:YbdD/YjiX family protein [Paeniglutamicibacter antarcticus]|uniref:YbdD/YjiX family protein n=2 Tax=Arthrobacter terrae TaxID=2935737 RepID=A0A931CXC0_9MICC|nr:YbdD/YjiX family protein [Arthrobacter terrae]
MRTLAAGLKHVVAYTKGVLGEDAYDKYVAYHRTVHDDAAPMTVKEFWRDKTDREGSNPQGRCC